MKFLSLGQHFVLILSVFVCNCRLGIFRYMKYNEAWSCQVQTVFRLNFFDATLQIFNRDNSIVALVNIFNGFWRVLLHIMYEITLNCICLRAMYTFVNFFGNMLWGKYNNSFSPIATNSDSEILSYLVQV